jgi:hypothetical protein
MLTTRMFRLGRYANCLLSVMDHCLRSRHYVNVVIAGKHPAPQWLTMDAAAKQVSLNVLASDELFHVGLHSKGWPRPLPCIGRKVNTHDLGLLVHHKVDETGILVGEAVVILTQQGGW